MLGVLYLRLHALPEHIAHRTGKVQLQIVAVLGLLALFTHNHVYWIAGLLLALIPLPDFSTPLAGMAASLAKMADRRRTPARPRGDSVAAACSRNPGAAACPRGQGLEPCLSCFCARCSRSFPTTSFGVTGKESASDARSRSIRSGSSSAGGLPPASFLHCC